MEESAIMNVYAHNCTCTCTPVCNAVGKWTRFSPLRPEFDHCDIQYCMWKPLGLSPGTSSRIDNPLALRLHQCQQDIEKSCRTCLSIVLEYIYALILYYHVFFIVFLIGCRNRNGGNRLLVGRCMGIWQWHDLLQWKHWCNRNH